MIFSGIENMGETPFPEVLIHGLVRDSQGRKMSKSLGNGVDPLELIDKYGADTLRFSLSMGVAPGGDIRFSEDKMESSRNFMNKIWNASRYVRMYTEGRELKDISEVKLTAADKWILKKLNNITGEAKKNIEKYEFGLALAKLYDFVWSDFCDWYIELTKPVLYSADDAAKTDALSVLNYVLKAILKLCHPFIPFITEEIWSNFSDTTLMTERYPEETEAFDFEEDFDIIKEIIGKIRNIRAEMKVPVTKTFPLYLIAGNYAEKIKEASIYIEKLAGVTKITFINSKDELTATCSQSATNEAEIFIPLGELVDLEKELARLQKEAEKVTAEISRGENMLSNEGFVKKAPAKLIDAEKEKLAANRALLEKINQQIADIRA